MTRQRRKTRLVALRAWESLVRASVVGTKRSSRASRPNRERKWLMSGKGPRLRLWMPSESIGMES